MMRLFDSGPKISLKLGLRNPTGQLKKRACGRALTRDYEHDHAKQVEGDLKETLHRQLGGGKVTVCAGGLIVKWHPPAQRQATQATVRPERKPLTATNQW